MLSRIRRFAALDSSDQWIFVQAWFLLGRTRISLLATRFKKLVVSLKHHREHPGAPSLDPGQQAQAVRIGELVAIAARYTPWQSRCLAQVLATQRLLAKHHIPGQFYLGVRPGCERTSQAAGPPAHAWLQCGDRIVSGGHGHEQFTVVSTFSWGGRA